MSDARIHDLGYHRYDGVRLGVGAAARSLAWHTFGALVGRRRSVWAKLLTAVIAAMAYLPAIVFVGFALLVPDELRELLLPGSGEYLGFIGTAVMLFVVLGAPVALCPDRRSGVLALYLASQLDRDTYLVAKAAAVIGFLTLVTIGPSLLLIVGLLLVGSGVDGLAAILGEVVRAVASGLLYSLLFAGVGLAVSSVTERRTAAAAGVAMWLIGSAIVVRGILVEALDRSQVYGLLDVSSLADEVVRRIYGGRGGLDDVGTAAVLVAALLWVVATLAFTRWRYQRLQVTR